MLSDCGRQLYNACLGECLKKLKAIQQTELYKETIRLSRTTEADIEKRRVNFKHLNETFGFTDYSIQSFGTRTKNDSKFIAVHLGTHICQKISTRAFKAVQKFAFMKAKKVWFKRKGEFVSLERANNPNNYQSNGVVKKGKKKWVNSKRYIKIRSKYRELERKIKEVRKQLHGRDTNQILQLASSIQTEKLSYKAFQKMFGKSIARKAPSMFLKMLKRKVISQGGTFREFPTYSTKLSQTCHCGAIKKKRLKDRWHICECGVHAQRDLYSAFLARCVSKSEQVDIQKAGKDWFQISSVLDECISELKNRKPEKNSYQHLVYKFV